MNELGGPAIATVVLGLLAALAGGCADFGGGLLARRTALFGVVLLSQFVGMLLAIVLAIGRGESAPTQADLAWSVLGGIAAGIGFTALYQALAVGRMGIVAPVTRRDRGGRPGRRRDRARGRARAARPGRHRLRHRRRGPRVTRRATTAAADRGSAWR